MIIQRQDPIPSPPETAVPAQPPPATFREPPLCVDLDGTLIAGDLLWESLIALMRSQPWLLLLLPWWLLRGRAYLKEQLASRVQLDAGSLPYRQEVLALLRREKAANRYLVLATASNVRLARAVADHLDLFDEVLASDTARNLKGRNKLKALQEQFGQVGFDYIGDARADLPLWEASRKAYLIQPSRRLLRQAQARCTPNLIETPRPRPIRAAVKLMRPHQWAKNLLLFVALIGAHMVSQGPRLLACCLAFLAFSACASAIYILNDLTDLEADRRHPTKCRRPLASGALSIPTGLVLLGLLLGGSFTLSLAALPLLFTGSMVLYLILTTWYSLHLKREPIVDVFVLAGLYTLRIVAGGLAATVPVSGWLLAFAIFFFISLALAKRYAELARAAEENSEGLQRRGYLVEDLGLIRSLGPASGYMAILTMCLYINAPETRQLYSSPQLLWGVCLVLFYWITRVWFLAQRRLLHEDPVIFAIKDPTSYFCGAVVAAVLLIASAGMWGHVSNVPR